MCLLFAECSIDNVLIRADAVSPIGIGHLMRCVALAHSLRNVGARAIFLTNCDSPLLVKRLLADKFEIKSHSNFQGGEKDIDETLNSLEVMSRQNAIKPWLVIDGDQFGTSYLTTFKNQGYRILLFDDNMDRPHYPCDLLLNANIGAEEFNYGPEAKQVLLGPDYMLMRPEFVTQAKSNIASDNVDLNAMKLLITIGGEDPFNTTQLIMEAASILGPNSQTVVVAGPANANVDSLRSKANTISSDVYVEINPDMPSRMSWADIAITAGGHTCWELAYMGIPFLVFSFANNQIRNARLLDKRNIAIDLGWHTNLTVSNVAKCLENLATDVTRRRNMIESGKNLVDGDGGRRIINSMLNVV